MSIDVAKELRLAKRGGYALGAFNTSNLEITKAICTAASRHDGAILIQTTPGALEYAGIETLFDIVRDEIERFDIKAAIHLDHAKDISIVKEALKVGYPSVMFDGSKYHFEENIALTQKVVRMAREFDVAVEAEVGIIGHEEGGRLSGQSVLSAPEQVKRFVDLTGVDSIAISVGNEHGAPKGEHLDLALLQSIAKVVHIPLVVHGASGLPPGDIKAAIKLGVAKFNIDTNIRRAFTEAIEKSDDDDPREMLKEGIEKVQKVVEHYIQLFSGK